MLGARHRARSFGERDTAASTAGRLRRGRTIGAALAVLAVWPLACAPRAHARPYRYAARQAYRQPYQSLRWDIAAGGNITQGTTSQYLDNGWTFEAGLTWFPAYQSLVGVRLDVNYSRFDATHQFIERSTRFANTEIDGGLGRIWGGDADLVLHFPLGQRAYGYLLGGVGTYQRQIELTQKVLASGYFCDLWWGVCGFGYAPFDSVVSRTTTATHFAWNAGAGVEWPVSPTTSLFIEARFVRINPADERTELVPITFGLRF